MPTWAIIVLAVFGAFLLLALLGALAASLRNRRGRERFGSSLDEVDRSLADARATTTHTTRPSAHPTTR